MKFLKTPFLQKNIRETASTCVFKLFSIDALRFFWCVSDLTQGHAFSFAQKQPPDVFYKKKMFLKIFQNAQENTCVAGPKKRP